MVEFLEKFSVFCVLVNFESDLFSDRRTDGVDDRNQTPQTLPNPKKKIKNDVVSEEEEYGRKRLSLDFFRRENILNQRFYLK